MTLQEQISQVVLITIAALSGGIAWEFYKSRDGRLRVLIIQLFSAKVFLYGGAALYYWLMPPIDFVYVRIIICTPMFIVMLKLWRYIRLSR